MAGFCTGPGLFCFHGINCDSVASSDNISSIYFFLFVNKSSQVKHCERVCFYRGFRVVKSEPGYVFKEKWLGEGRCVSEDRR